MKAKISPQEAADLLGIELPRNKLLVANLGKFVKKQGIEAVRSDPEKYRELWSAFDKDLVPTSPGTEQERQIAA